MARIALALFAIVVLALSAGVTRTSLQSHSTLTVSSLRAFEPQTAMSAEIVPSGDLRSGPALQIPEDAPQPALIAYLSLVLIGSAVAVGLVRHRERGRVDT